MSSTRDPNHQIKLFLDEGLDELPDRSYDAVRAAIDQTRQWAVVGPWKEPQIMTATRFALIAAAIAVVAVVAIKFLPAGNVGQGPTPTTTPLLTPTPGPTPTPLSLTVNGEVRVPMEAGTYFVSYPFLVPFTVTVPTGWDGSIGGNYAAFLQKHAAHQNVSFTVDQHLYADACHPSAGFMNTALGPSASDLATALAGIRGLTSTGPTDVSIGGYTGKQVTLTAPTDVSGCDQASGGRFPIWQLPLGATEEIAPGWTDRFWVVDVGSQRLVIQTSGPAADTAADKAEVEAIISSIVLPPQN